jgi:D-alanyl-D-alanine carboxypeptidase/D-alanyl-D-alanine-endopeptidase (penicillin-binding protein 4)
MRHAPAPAAVIGPRRRLVRTSAALLLSMCAGMAVAALPPEVLQALRAAEVPPEAMAAVVQEVGAAAPPRLAERPNQPMNPASVFKLFTTAAALELLGPAYTWPTPVWLQGPVHEGVLDGPLVIQGRGDPRLGVERLWLLLQRVRGLGVREIRGGVLLDRASFAPAAASAGDFDGEPLRPYNVQADALLLNQRSVLYTFTPDPGRGIAHVQALPLLAGVDLPAQVPLAAGPCDDWRGRLHARFEPAATHFDGAFPAACGERTWPVAHPDAARYDSGLIEALWRELGGQLDGPVRAGTAPADRPPSFVDTSPPLADAVRDINKFSNNTMAQQLFLTLALERGGAGTPEAGRAVLRQWLVQRFGEPALAGVVIDNGSGLSREQRVSAALLAQLLQAVYASPTMPELMASLPLAGADGTLRRLRNGAAGRAHLKTGSLRDVVALTGYVLADSGRRYVLVAMVNHPRAQNARAALDALVQWAAADRPAP